MKYLGLSIKNILHHHVWTQIDVTKYYLKYILRNRKVIRETYKNRDTKKGKKAFVLANGPSVRNLDPEKLLYLQKSGYDIFAVNSFFCSGMSEVVSPNYYVVSDPVHFGYTSHLSDKQRLQFENDIRKVMEKKIVLFMPIQYFDKLDYANKYAFCDSENFFSQNVCDITRPRGYLSMTAYKALAIACFLGYENIYICGFDNNYFKTLVVDSDNVMFYVDRHFYNTDDNRDVLRKVQGFEGESIGELLYDYHFLFKHLEKFKNFPIVNLDKDGLVDCFSKKHDLDIYI